MADCIKGKKVCPHLYKCSKEGETITLPPSTIKELDLHHYYCKKTQRVRKIGSVESWSGSTPKWCPLGRG